MTSIPTAATAYARMALAPAEVAPVRAIGNLDDRYAARQQGARLAAQGQPEQQQRPDVIARATQANVIELPGVSRDRVEPAPLSRRAQPFVPFLAQQIAQEGLPDEASATRQKHEAVTDAYILASDDEARILGPVRPRQLII